MKKILTLLGTITLIGTSTTSLVACKPQYSEEQLKELKDKNSKIINSNKLEWMASQEKPFNKVDNKWYFVIWRDNKGRDWRIAKFKNSSSSSIKIDNFNNRQLEKTDLGMGKTLYVINLTGFIKYVTNWLSDDFTYIKIVYRWDGKGEPDTPVIDPKTGKITDWDKVKDVKEDK